MTCTAKKTYLRDINPLNAVTLVLLIVNAFIGDHLTSLAHELCSVTRTKIPTDAQVFFPLLFPCLCVAKLLEYVQKSAKIQW